MVEWQDMEMFWGKVRRGKGRGKALGFPTANITLRKTIPEGIYIARTRVDNRWHPSLVFIGSAKTFGETNVHAESCILSFDKELYGRWISIRLLKKIRGNREFTSANELVAQMKEDKKAARAYFITKRELSQKYAAT